MKRQQLVFFSRVGDYDNFEEGVNDNDSFSLGIPSMSDLIWIESLESLMLGTSAEEWKIGTNKLEGPITPTNFTVKQQTSYGSIAIQPIKVNDVILFIDNVGRKIREISFNGDKYIADDLTELAEHLTRSSGIKWVAHQKNPDSIIWCGLSDGTLLSMTYTKYETTEGIYRINGWSVHPIGGNGKVISGCVVPGEDEDEIWIIVERIVNEETFTYIEKFAPRYFGKIEDAFFVDCGVTKIYETPVYTIEDLEYLEHETVSILGDGYVFSPQKVIDGKITLPEPVRKAQIGLNYTYKLQPLKFVFDTREGTTFGSIMNVNEIVCSFIDTLNAKYGSSDSELYDIEWPVLETFDDPPKLFTGELTLSFDGGFNTDMPIIIAGNDPLPCIVRAIIARTEKSGK